MTAAESAIVGPAALRGRIRPAAPLDRMTWLRVGGPAEWLFKPQDTADLAAFMTHRDPSLPVTPIGVGSNLLVRDGGIPGIVVRLGRGFSRIEVHGDQILAGAGALDVNVARVAADAGLEGLEFLSGIPGTLGGAVRMNAGAYGRELRDVLVHAEIVLADGQIERMDAEALDLAYRRSALPEGSIVASVVLRGRTGDADRARARIAEIREQRDSSQPVRTRTGGSTFANPPGDSAWRLIDAAGCRGLVVGDARISPMHANFLENMGEATARDLEELGEEVRRRVHAHAGVTLRWEIRRVGIPAGEDGIRHGAVGGTGDSRP